MNNTKNAYFITVSWVKETKIYEDTEAKGHRELDLIGVLPGFAREEGRARPDWYCLERLEKRPMAGETKYR